MSATGVPALPFAGLVRERLTSPFGDLWLRRLGLVVAPAGSGKTTLLHHVVRLVQVPVAWYTAEDVVQDVEDLLAQLHQAFCSAMGLAGEPWATVGDAVRAIEEGSSTPVLLVVDDLHELEGTEAEGTLERLIQAAPAMLAVLVASRSTPAWNLSRRRVTGDLVEVSGDDLRFRSWEVERLFREHYGSPLGPEDLATLTRFTEGWPAGLQLFHLATQAKPPNERRRMVGSLGTGFRLVREYLIHNVLAELPVELRHFLLETCVLGRLRAQVCDEFRGTTGSQALLGELERRQLITPFIDGGDWFRCQDVLRAHLEATFHEGLSEAEAKSRYGWAASLLEAAGAVSDALRAYCRAENWEAAARLLGHKGEELSQTSLGWSDWLPPALVRHDPWFLLSEARRHRADASWAKALAAYQEAEQSMPAAAPAEVCRRERATLSSWLQPTPVPACDWFGLLRAALLKDPMAVYRREADSDDPRRILVAGLAALAAGVPASAASALAVASSHEAASPTLAAVAELALAAAQSFAGCEETRVHQAAEQLESLGIGALTRLTTALSRLSSAGFGPRDGAELRRSCRQSLDPWGEAVGAFLQGWATLSSAKPGSAFEAVEPLEAAARGFERLGAPILELFASSLRALAWVRAGDPRGRSAASQAEAASRSLGVPGAQAVAAVALSECYDAGEVVRAEAMRLASYCGLAVPGLRPGAQTGVGEPRRGASVVLQCFRGFRLSVGGDEVDLRPLKPRARRVLRILAVHFPEWVHREALIDAVWPEADPPTGTRNLQVAISSLRHAVEPDAARGGSLITRQGEAYRLALPDDAWVDHAEFDRAITRARLAQAGGDHGSARTAYEEALAVAAGPLLPEDGPEDWLLPKRDRYRSDVCQAAHALAELLVQSGEPQTAAAACERGLAADRCSDALWRLLVHAHEVAGDVASAARARREYAAVLAELGVPPADQGGWLPASNGK